jgi:hypothetical protein
MLGKVVKWLGGETVEKIGGVIDSLHTSDEEKAAARLEIEKLIAQREVVMTQATAEIIKAEAQGHSWLQRNWRPMTMMIFVFLITARWFGYSYEGMTEAELIEAWKLVKLGLTGYVGGRTLEKIVPQVMEKRNA